MDFLFIGYIYTGVFRCVFVSDKKSISSLPIFKLGNAIKNSVGTKLNERFVLLSFTCLFLLFCSVACFFYMFSFFVISLIFYF